MRRGAAFFTHEKASSLRWRYVRTHNGRPQQELTASEESPAEADSSGSGCSSGGDGRRRRRRHRFCDAFARRRVLFLFRSVFFDVSVDTEQRECLIPLLERLAICGKKRARGCIRVFNLLFSLASFRHAETFLPLFFAHPISPSLITTNHLENSSLPSSTQGAD